MTRAVYTVDQLAERLGLSRGAVHAMIGRGEIKAFRVGHLIRIRADVAEALPIPPKVPSFVYFIATRPPRGKKIKIGFATNVHKRLKALQTSSPVKLQLVLSFPGTRQDEQALHKRFAEHRMEGEWFRWCKAIADYIDEQFDADQTPNEWDYT